MLSLISCTAVFLKSKRQSLSSCGKAQMNFLANPTVWINLVKALNICYGMNCISPEFYVQALVPCVTVLEMRLLCVCVTVWVCVNCSFLFDSVTPWTLAHQAPLSMEFTRPEWVVIPFSRGSSWPRDPTQVSCIAGRFFIICHQEIMRPLRNAKWSHEHRL